MKAKSLGKTKYKLKLPENSEVKNLFIEFKALQCIPINCNTYMSYISVALTSTNQVKQKKKIND